MVNAKYSVAVALNFAYMEDWLDFGLSRSSKYNDRKCKSCERLDDFRASEIAKDFMKYQHKRITELEAVNDANLHHNADPNSPRAATIQTLVDEIGFDREKPVEGDRENLDFEQGEPSGFVPMQSDGVEDTSDMKGNDNKNEDSMLPEAPKKHVRQDAKIDNQKELLRAKLATSYPQFTTFETAKHGWQGNYWNVTCPANSECGTYRCWLERNKKGEILVMLKSLDAHFRLNHSSD